MDFSSLKNNPKMLFVPPPLPGENQWFWKTLPKTLLDRFSDQKIVQNGGKITKMVPKWNQNGAQNRPKLKQKINMKNYRFWDRFGVVLGQFWVVFGPILGWKIIKIHWFLKGFVKIVFLKKIKLKKATWTELGPILMPKRLPNRSQNGAKMASKNNQKIRSVFDRF